ncbi:MAG: aminotransferase [Hyphomicrobiaceae bacterium]|nr:MAG: aminotransferase [Hyphomicrobiaceae bacterium]
MTRQPQINQNLLDTGTPPIPEARSWLDAYEGRHGPGIDLSQAVPGYPPPPELLGWLAEAARDPAAAQYGAINGDEELRRAYARHAGAVYGAEIDASQVMITAGCNQAFVTVSMAVAKAGEAILLRTPWYFNHAMTLGMLGIEALPLAARGEDGFVPDPKAAERLIDNRTRAIALVTPNNPTGAIYPPETIAAFARLCAGRGLWLIIDETYRDFLPDSAARPPHALLADKTLQGRVIQLYSFSKSYCVPGHRIGAVIAAEAFLCELAKVQDCVQICAPRVGQMALARAIPALGAWREANRALIGRRARAFKEAMAEVNRWQVGSLGGYFAYLRHPFSGQSSASIAQRLARNYGLLVLPGSYFGPGQEGYLRVAFANVDERQIRDFARRLRSVEA